MNRFKVINLICYVVLGIILGKNGIDVVENPIATISILLIVGVIDTSSFVGGRSKWVES